MHKSTNKRDLKKLFNIVDERTLIISGFGYFVGKQSGRLIIKKGKEIIAQYAMSNLDEVLIMSRGVSISTSLINDACKQGIKISIWSNSYPNVMLSSPQLAAFAEVKRAQFDALDKRIGLDLVKSILASKISNQAALIKYSIKNRPDLLQIRDSADYMIQKSQSLELVKSENLAQVRTRLLNIEAITAHTYWRAFAQILKVGYGFEGRDHSGGDVVNVALNYGYAILYSLTWMGILNAGMEPFAGFLHTDRPGKPSLVLDLSEPFKPRLVDKVVLSLVNKRRRLTLENRNLDDLSKKLLAYSIISELNKKETYNGKRLTLRSIIQGNIYSAASMLKGNGKYEKYVFKW